MGGVEVIQFHPSYSYEDFIEGIRPESVERPDGQIVINYPVRKGTFRSFCEQAALYSKRRYVLIIDEINRGELSRIFGELLYSLEYRDAPVKLQYSGQEFVIPPNVYIIGTMNTADRSIALIDHALRRRFHFIPILPKPEILRNYLGSNGESDFEWLAGLIELANKHLEDDGIDWHLHIGHSHLMQQELDQPRIQMIWQKSIMPTLEEYFYRQADKLDKYKLAALMEELGSSWT